MTEHITVSRELLRQVLNTISPPQESVRTQEAYTELRAALEQPAVEPPSDLKAKWLGDALFDCIRAAKILRDDINELTVAELLHFAKDLKDQLERTAPQAQQPAVEPIENKWLDFARATLATAHQKAGLKS